MAIAFVAATTAGASSSTTSLSVTVPAGSTNDVLLLSIANSNGATINTPAGWTKVTSNGDASDVQDAVFWRVATGSEPASYSATIASAGYLCGIMTRYSGVDTTSPIRSSSSSTTPTPGSGVTASTACAAPSGVTAADMVAQFYGFGSWNAAANTAVFPRYPTGSWNQRTTAKDGATASHSFVAAMTAVDLLGATGTYPTTNATTTSGGSTAVPGTWATIAVALRAAPVAAAATLSGAGSLTASATDVKVGAVTMAGAGSLTSDATIPAAGPTASLTGAGSLAVPAPAATIGGTVTMAGAGSLSAAGTVPVPIAPGTQLNIGTADVGKQRYELQTAYAGDASITTKTVAQVAAGFDDGTTFTSNADGTAVRFRVRADAPLTSAAAGGPRSELREMELDGITEKAFDATVGTNWIQVTSRAVLAPDGHLNGMVLLQIHDDTSDNIEICTQLSGGKLKLLCRINGTSVGIPHLDDDYQADINTPGKWFTARIAVGDFGWKIYYNDMSRPAFSSSDPGMSALTLSGLCYFKAGLYTQQHVDEAIDTTRWMESQMLAGSLKTYHPGYADPRALSAQPGQVSNVRAGALTVLQNSPAGSMNTVPAFPTGADAPVDGDLCIIADWVYHSQENHAQGSVQTPTTPAGWTRKATNGAYGGPKTGTGASPYHSAIRLSWYYARYQSSGVGGINTAPTMTVSGSQTDDWHASRMIVVSGAVASGDPTDVLGAFTAVDATPAITGAASSSVLGPAAGVTTTLDGSLVLVALMGEYGMTAGTGVPVLSGDALSWVEVGDYGGTSGNVMTLALDYALVTAAQTIADKSATVAFTTAAKSIGQMWALKRAAAEVTAAASMLAVGSLTAGATAELTGATVSLAGAGSLTVGAVVDKPAGAVAMTATGSLTATATREQLATVPMLATGSLTAGAVATAVATVSMLAAGSLTATGTREQPATVSMLASGNLTASAVATATATVSMLAAGSLLATAVREPLATVSMLGTGSLVATAVRVKVATVSMLGSGDLVATAGVSVPAGSVTMLAIGSMSVATPEVLVPAAAVLLAVGSLTAGATDIKLATVNMLGAAVLSAEIVGGGSGAAVLHGVGSLSSSAGVTTFGPSITMLAAGVLTIAAPAAGSGGAASLQGVGALSAAAVRVALAAATLQAVGSLTVAVSGGQTAAASLLAQGVLTAAAGRAQFGAVAMLAQGVLTCQPSGLTLIGGLVRMLAIATLTAQVLVEQSWEMVIGAPVYYPGAYASGPEHLSGPYVGTAELIDEPWSVGDALG